MTEVLNDIYYPQKVKRLVVPLQIVKTVCRVYMP